MLEEKMIKRCLEKKANIKNLIALTHITTSYKEFSDKLMKYMELSNRCGLSDLYYVSHGEIVLFSKNSKKFYNENKDIIDTINTYSDIVNFAKEVCNENGDPNKISCMDEVYNYLVNNPSLDDTVASKLQKLDELGINDLTLDEQADFNSEVYEPFINIDSNFRITYLDNMVALPTYRDDCVKYGTTNSCYKIVINTCLDNEKHIFLNDFLFDSTKLPSDLSNEGISKMFQSLKDSQKENSELIKKSIDLNVSVLDLQVQYARTKQQIEQLDAISNKEELLNSLADISLRLNSLRRLTSNYDDKIIEENPELTKETLVKEKRLYLERRNLNDVNV